MIPENHVHFMIALRPQVRTIGQIRIRAVVQGAAQHAVVGGHPAKPALRGQMEHFIRHRAFRRPEPGGGASQLPLHVLARAFQLIPRIVRILKAGWE